MQDNVRIIPEGHFDRVDQLATQNRFEDTQNPVKIIQTVASKWMEHGKELGNRTQTHRQFVQHMEIVRRKTEEEFKKPIVMAEKYRVESPKRLSEHKRKHIYLYSNPQGARDGRPKSTGIELTNGHYRTKSKITPVTDLENDEDKMRVVAEKEIVKTYRYARDRNDSAEQVQEIEVRQLSRQYDRDNRQLPRMSEKIHQQRMLRDQEERRQSNNDRYKQNRGKKTSQFNSDTESVFQRLADKAQHLYSNLNAEERRQETQNMLNNSTEIHQKYYQPEGHRLVDTKLEEIRKRKKAIEEEIDRRLGPDGEINQPAENSHLQVNRSQPFSKNNKTEAQNEVSRQTSRGIEVISKQHESSLSKGRQLAEILNIDTVAFNAQRTKPAGITVTQAGQFDSDLKNSSLGMEHTRGIQKTVANGQLTDAMKNSQLLHSLKQHKKQFINVVSREVDKSKKFQPNKMSYESDEEFEDSDIDMKESEPSMVQRGKMTGGNIKVVHHKERQSIQSENMGPSIINELDQENSSMTKQQTNRIQIPTISQPQQANQVANQGAKIDVMDQAMLHILDKANKQSNLNVHSNLNIQSGLSVQAPQGLQQIGQLNAQKGANPQSNLQMQQTANQLQNNMIARTNAHMPNIEVHTFGLNQQAKSVSPVRTSEGNPAFFSPNARPSQHLVTVTNSQKGGIPITPSLPAVPALRKSGVIEAPNSALKIMPNELPVNGMVLKTSGIRNSGLALNNSVVQGQGIMTFTNIEQTRGVPPAIIPHPAAVNFARSLAQGTLTAPVNSNIGPVKAPGLAVESIQPETERALLGPPIHNLIKNANVYQSVQPPLSSTNLQSKAAFPGVVNSAMQKEKEKKGRTCCCTVF